MNAATMVDIDSLLDGTLDDLADIPEFKPFPAGAHRITIKWDMKEVNSQKCPEITLTAVETVELSNHEDTPLAQGDSTSVLYMFKKKDGTPNELGQGQFKAVIAALSEAVGGGTNREIMEKSNGMEVLAVTSIREDKRDKNNIKYYTALDSVQVM